MDWLNDLCVSVAKKPLENEWEMISDHFGGGTGDTMDRSPPKM